MREEKKKVKSIVGGGAGPKFLLFTPSFDLHIESFSLIKLLESTYSSKLTIGMRYNLFFRTKIYS